MTKLKAGDTAEFIQDYEPWKKKGDRFIVTKVGREDGGMTLVYGLGYGVFLKRLKKVATDKKETKKKILYPVGTIVQLVEETILEDNVASSVMYHGPLEVISYTKGSNRPYEVKRLEGAMAGHVESRKLNVRHLRPYEKPVDNEPSKEASLLVGEAKMKEAELRFANKLAQIENDFRRITAQPTTVQTWTIIKPKKEKKKIMTTIREKIRYATLSSDEKLLRENQILSENGNLTDVGRRVVLDILFEDKDLRKQVVEAVASTVEKK